MKSSIENDSSTFVDELLVHNELSGGGWSPYGKRNDARVPTEKPTKNEHHPEVTAEVRLIGFGPSLTERAARPVSEEKDQDLAKGARRASPRRILNRP